ncbi:hypothetical protein [Telluribacter sp. SYSU D00476]|uniref:hypothetical protein n=1 Tax=Telluribacter sp. SYSU D00476 TaxID=2811430 RepID=UPI001FF187A6|nr:hypothetical protein [Telluribacter sp. SYSU D00476]
MSFESTLSILMLLASAVACQQSDPQPLEGGLLIRLNASNVRYALYTESAYTAGSVLPISEGEVTSSPQQITFMNLNHGNYVFQYCGANCINRTVQVTGGKTREYSF